MNDTPYLALTGELWVSFVIYTKKNDRDISRARCISLKQPRNWGPFQYKHILTGKWIPIINIRLFYDSLKLYNGNPYAYKDIVDIGKGH